MFTIQKDKLGDFDKFKLTNKKTEEYVSIIPSFGGNVQELILKIHDRFFSIIDGDSTHEALIKNKSYKGAKLTPFPNRIEDGQFVFNGRKYQLPINHPAENHAIHGLLFDKTFTVKKMAKNELSAVLELEFIYNNDVKGYPFSFHLILNYSFTDEGLKVETIVKNIGNSEMPFADGWHPYFKIDDTIDDLLLRIPGTKKIIVNKRMIPTGEITIDERFTRLSRIDNTLFDTGFFIDTTTGKSITQLHSKKNDISINIWQETGTNKYNYLQVYTPPDRKSIAIEPMSSNTNSYNNGDGLIILKPGEIFQAAYGVYIS